MLLAFLMSALGDISQFFFGPSFDSVSHTSVILLLGTHLHFLPTSPLDLKDRSLRCFSAFEFGVPERMFLIFLFGRFDVDIKMGS